MLTSVDRERLNDVVSAKHVVFFIMILAFSMVMIEDNFSRGIPIVHGECYRRYRHNHVFLKVMFYKGNCYDDDSPEGRKGRSCYFITRGPLMSIAPAGGPPWYYSM